MRAVTEESGRGGKNDTSREFFFPNTWTDSFFSLFFWQMDNVIFCDTLVMGVPGNATPCNSDGGLDYSAISKRNCVIMHRRRASVLKRQLDLGTRTKGEAGEKEEKRDDNVSLQSTFAAKYSRAKYSRAKPVK